MQRFEGEMANEDLEICGMKHSLQFSSGILVSSLVKAGMAVEKSYDIAEKVRTKLIHSNKSRIPEVELTEHIIFELEQREETVVSRNYRFLQKMRNDPQGVVIFIGGVTGIGKSTVAREVSYRLGINSTIGTDSIRQVMRKTMSSDLLPELHESTFQTHRAVQSHPIISNVIMGFERQCRLVSVGVDAIRERCEKEGTSSVVEGIHLVPGYYKKPSLVLPFVLHLEDLHEHRDRIHNRSYGTLRKADRYLDHLENIKSIQSYIKLKAKEHDVPVIENNSIDETVDIIVQQTIQKLAECQEMQPAS